MGKSEQDVRKEIRRTKINSTVVRVLAVSGKMAIELLTPGVLEAMEDIGVVNRHQKKQNVEKSLSRLIRRGYVVVEGNLARLTQKGEKFAALLGEGKLAPRKPKRWDGKWRLLVFDIPERRKKSREQIRITLTQLGFRRLQDSVWVYPYDCEDLITLLKIDLKIGKDILYIIADEIEYDLPLRSHFGLH
jgi:DNA-binding transcriptional regulator PaaX